ncbi:MAG: DNA polymerase I [Faecousia sp.]
MKLMILDGNSVINRAFYGVRLLSTKDGMYTNAIYGFLNILQKMEHEEQPDALCVAFDLHGPTFRHLRYDGYKATRHPMPEELAMQMPVMKQVLSAMNIPIYACQGWEADDVIGTVGKRCGQAGWDCVIVTGDRDSLQLIDSHVKVKLVVSKGGQTTATLYDTEKFQAEYGFAPERLIDLKSLMGDSSDNIPGVAGVGPKTASELLHRFGSLDGVYANLSPENMKGKLFEKLQNGRQSAYLSYELATIRCEAPIDFAPADCLRKPPRQKELYDLFRRLEFSKLIDRYGLRAAAMEQTSDAQPETAGTCSGETVTSGAQAEALAERLAGRAFVPIVFTRNLDACAVQEGDSLYYLTREALKEDYLPAVRMILTRCGRKVTHDLKPLMRTLMEQSLPVDGFTFDTALAAYLLDASRGKYELAAVAERYAGLSLPASGDSAPACALCSAAAAVGALYEPLLEQLRRQGSEKLYFDMELPLCRVLAQMETAGVCVDREALHRFGEMLKTRIADCQAEIYRYAGEEFNINSTKKLGQILFEKLELPAVKKTKTGYSTNVEVLEKLKDRHPIIGCIMDYRTLTKLQSTYADGLLKVIAPDGRIHTTFQNTVTATGRLSSTDPNLQNIPVRTELGSEIRKMFVPRPGWVLVDADYSQIELRVLAHIADDHAMQEAFRSGEDFHTVTASHAYGVPVEQVTPQMRRSAKAVNFGIVYGISEFSLAEDIGVTRWEAKDFIDSYLRRYSGVRTYMHDVVEQAKQTGFVTTLFGRRRYLPELHDAKYMVRQSAERMAMNTPIQGTAADIIKLAMLRVSEALEENGLQARLLLQVHDELIVECPPEEAEQVMQIVTRQMQGAAELSVPLIAEAKMGKSWYEAK